MLDMAGIDTVLKLRSEDGQPHRDLNDAAKDVNDSSTAKPQGGDRA